MVSYWNIFAKSWREHSERLLDSCWALLKRWKKPLGNAQRLLDSVWAILTGYWKIPGKCPNYTDTHWEMFLSAGSDDKSGKWDHQLTGEKAKLLSSCQQGVANFIPFLWKPCYSFAFIESRTSHEKLKKTIRDSSPIFLFPTRLLLVKLKFGRQPL
jgi:hypothetical protein